MSILDTIKQTIADMTINNQPEPVQESATDDIPNEIFAEFAKLVPELDDLSIEGDDIKEGNTSRPLGPVLTIPLDDDIELETLEFNINDGRLTDIPGDADVHTEASYISMKSYDEFYNEAYQNVISAVSRSSQEQINEIAKSKADTAYAAYTEKCYQEGMFGFDKISVDDNKVPGSVTVNLGAITDDLAKPFYSRLKVLYQLIGKNKILKKQLDSINILQQQELFVTIKEAIANRYNCKPSEVWEKFIPKNIIVPAEPRDEFSVGLAFAPEDDENNISYFVWSKKIKEVKGTSSSTDISGVSFKPVSDNKDNWLTKAECVKEQLEIKSIPSRFGKIFQEAIDFNGGEQQGEAIDAPVDNTNEPPTEEPENEGNGDGDTSKPKVELKPNDVSDQIVQNLSANNDNPATNGEVNNNTDVSGSGLAGEPTPTDSDDDGDTDDLTGSESDGITDNTTDDMSGDINNEDLDNMTIDELLSQAGDKLKSMPIAQLKQFINGQGDLQSSTGGLSALDKLGVGDIKTEAFVWTGKTINNEIDASLRKVLGILNDDTKSTEEIFNEFEPSAKRLNSILAKAVKKSKPYDENQIIELNRLNKYTVDLVNLVSNRGSDFVTKAKPLINDFLKSANSVGKIIEEKKTHYTTKRGK